MMGALASVVISATLVMTLAIPPLEGAALPEATSVRDFRTLNVIVKTPQASDADLRQLAFKVDRISVELPPFWNAATSFLSTMRVLPPRVISDEAPMRFQAEKVRGVARAAYIDGDDYDFINLYYVAQDLASPWHQGLRNSRLGIGLPLYDDPSLKASRLLGVNVIPIPSRWLYEPDLPGAWMQVILHEYAHAWCCYLRAPESSGLPDLGMLDEAGAHWSRTLLMPALPLSPQSNIPLIQSASGYQHDCGRPFLGTVTPDRYRFTALELYLMGLQTPVRVAPLEFLIPASPLPSTARICSPFAATKRLISIEDLIRRNGYAADVASLRTPISSPTGHHARWHAQSGHLDLDPGESGWLWLAFQNTGTTTWVRGSPTELRLGINGDDGTMWAAGMSVAWAMPSRPAIQSETRVGPGQIATFAFQVQGVTTGRYMVHLRPVIDGVQWLENEGVFLAVSVRQPHHSKWVDQTPYPTLAVNGSATATVRFRNTGSSTWAKGTATEARLGLNLDDRSISELGMAIGWPYPERPAIQSESMVRPGEIATFTFRLRGTRPGVFQLHLRPVIDGITWMEDEGVYFGIAVR